MDGISNILAERYASQEMCDIWSPTARIHLERQLWISVLKAQRELGLAIPEENIAAFERVIDDINLESIQQREKVTRHDVKAKIEEFCEIAGCEGVHQGMTSRDLTETVEQLQVFHSLKIIQFKSAAALLCLGKLADDYKDQVLTARTHNVAAQTTTVGRRIAMFGEELLHAWHHLDYVINNFALRGLKGAVGTQLDTLNLMQGDHEKARLFEKKIVESFEIGKLLDVPGQVYPRSLDFEAVSSVFQLCSGPSSLAKTIRLMAGHELASEGFLPGQVGSSAMPHKVNSRSCERICGFHAILRGHLNMAASLAGDQWNEGDVSCSVVRRTMLPDSFYAADGLFETLITVLQNMAINREVVDKEHRHYLPFLLTTTVLMESVKKGAGRESIHEAIKEHALAASKSLRKGETTENDLLERLAKDERIPLDSNELQVIRVDGAKETGRARHQTEAFVKKLLPLRQRFPNAGEWKPGAIL